ncbi:MAG: DUF4350 domain-containing protein, partial [Candidatus Hodarchaeales archaeon]
QGLGSVLMFSNHSDLEHPGQNFTSIHLPFMVFGLRYNSNLSLLIDFKILKELHLVTNMSEGQSGYTRYSGVLSDDTLIVAIVIETFDYTTDLSDRINAYKFSFAIINSGAEKVENVSLVSYFKADCFANETGLLSGNGTELGLNALDSAMDFANDDEVIFNQSRDLIYVIDQNNRSDFNYEKDYAAYGFNSTSHNLTSWEISPAIDLLGNLTDGRVLRNQSNYTQGVDDPGFAMEYMLASELIPNNRVEFTGILGTGIGDSYNDTIESLFVQMDNIIVNTTSEDALEVLIIEANFSRIAYRGETYTSSILALNTGNVELTESALTFAVNRTSQQQRLEIFATIENIEDIGLWDLINVSSDWVPVYEDVYAVAWLAIRSDSTNLVLLQSSSLIAGFTSWNVYVVDREKYQEWSLSMNSILPSRIDKEPYSVYFPGDVEFWNLTFTTITPLNDIKVTIQGQHSDILDLNWTHKDILYSYDTLSINLVIPLVATPGIYSLIIEFRSGETVFYQIPVKFAVKPLQGRIFFDGIHNNITLSVTDSGIDFGWDERLDTTFGNFKLFKDLCNSRTPTGAGVQTLISGIDFDSSGLGFGDFKGNNDSSKETFFLPDTLKGYTFELDQLTTDFLHTDLLQIFDVSILIDPEVAYTADEIKNITKYVDKGGVVFIWYEGADENDIESVNELLQVFNLTTGIQDNGTFILDALNMADHAVTSKIHNITLQDPVRIQSIPGTTIDTLQVINDYMVTLEYGKGRVFVCGDKDLFNNTGLTQNDNYQFTQNLINWALSKDFPATLNMKQQQIKQGENIYFDISIDNYEDYEELLAEGSMFIYGFSAPDGSQVNMSSGAAISPFFTSEPGHFAAKYNSSWNNQTGLYFILILFDHSELVNEMFFVQFKVVEAPLAPPAEIFEPAPPLYDHIIDLAILVSILYMIGLQQGYRFFKWRKRYRFTVLEDEIKFQALTHLNEVKTINRSITGVINHSMYNEVEKVRFVLRMRKQLIKSLNRLRDFGSRFVLRMRKQLIKSLNRLRDFGSKIGEV